MSANLPSLQALQSRYGGNVLLHSLPTARKKSEFHWRIGSLSDCHSFIRAIEPYSIEKRVQLSLAREWLEHRSRIPMRGRRCPETYFIADRIHEAISYQKRLDFSASALKEASGGEEVARRQRGALARTNF